MQMKPCDSQVQHLREEEGLRTGIPPTVRFTNPKSANGPRPPTTPTPPRPRRRQRNREGTASGKTEGSRLARDPEGARRSGHGGRSEGWERGPQAHLARGAVGRARFLRCLCCSSAPGHSAPAQREWPQRLVLWFLRLRPRRAGSSEGASSCRQRLSTRSLTILGVSRRQARDPPGNPWLRGAQASAGFPPRCPIVHCDLRIC